MAGSAMASLHASNEGFLRPHVARTRGMIQYPSRRLHAQDLSFSINDYERYRLEAVRACLKTVRRPK